jgi:signal peptidase I
MADGPEQKDQAPGNPAPAPQPDAGAAEKIKAEPAVAAAVQQVGEVGSAGTPEAPATLNVPGQAGQAEGKVTTRDEEPSGLKEWIELLVRAGFWALLIYLFIFQVSVVDGPSMLPNFQHSDKLVIDKLTYRFGRICRFDVIVFETIDMDKDPRQPRDYIKRVIGLPGETVTIKNVETVVGGKIVRNGELWIDGKKIEENFAKEQYSGSGPQVETFKVPDRHYFVMGDNRGGSHDSRAQGIGFVPIGQIKGLVRMRWWPWARVDWFSRHTEQN